MQSTSAICKWYPASKKYTCKLYLRGFYSVSKTQTKKKTILRKFTPAEQVDDSFYEADFSRLAKAPSKPCIVTSASATRHKIDDMALLHKAFKNSTTA